MNRPSTIYGVVGPWCVRLNVRAMTTCPQTPTGSTPRTWSGHERRRTACAYLREATQDDRDNKVSHGTITVLRLWISASRMML